VIISFYIVCGGVWRVKSVERIDHISPEASLDWWEDQKMNAEDAEFAEFIEYSKPKSPAQARVAVQRKEENSRKGAV
jgi:hypothetical protein